MKHAYCILAGACDTFAGLLLVFVPDAALRLMRVGPAPADDVMLRWVGAFVASVGFSYFLPFFLRVPGRFVSMLAMTAWIRACIGTFAAFQIAAGTLSTSWMSVPATDFTMAAVQCVMLARGAFASDA